MIRTFVLATALFAFPWAASAQDVNAVISAGAKAMGIQDLDALGSYVYSGTGANFQVGDAKTPNSASPQITLAKYTRVIDFDAGGSWEEIIGAGSESRLIRRIPFSEPYGRVGQQFDIWMTPLAFLKTALSHHASVKALSVDGKQFNAVSFTSDEKYTFTGYFNNQNLLERVDAQIDHPVLGDTLVEAVYSDYKDLGHGLIFPSKIVTKEGGDPVLDLNITEAKRNVVHYVGELNYSVVNEGLTEYRGPRRGKAPPIFVDQHLYGDNAYYFGVKAADGNVYRSVVMEFTDYLVVIEAPLDDEHASAVLREIRKNFGVKPIRYVVNTHAHFQAMGGLRTYAAEGAIIITQQANKAYLEKVLAQPHSIHPDTLAQSNKKVVIEAVAEKRILTDGAHTIELHHVQNGHADGMLIAYLPKEKIVAETELYIARVTGFEIPPDGLPVPLPSAPDTRYSMDLMRSLDRLKLDYDAVLCLEGRPAQKSEFLADVKKAVASGASAPAATIPAANKAIR